MILVMAVAMTIGLAVVSRSITNIRISTGQEESARVFSVAEAGIEEALKAKFTAPQDVTIVVGDTDVKAHVVPSTLGGDEAFLFPKAVEAGEAQTIWLVGHDENEEPDPTVRYSQNSVDVCWGNEGTAFDLETTPALVATLFYQEDGEFKTQKFTADPNLARGAAAHFGNVTGDTGCDLDEKSLQFSKTIDFPSPLSGGGYYYFLRLKLIYNTDGSHLLGTRAPGGVSLPAQGKCYRSCAVLETSGTTRCVRQCQAFLAPLGIFDYVLYSDNDLTKAN